METDFQYAAVPDKLKEFLEKLRGVGIPDKATFNWLESLGYKSSNDRSMLRVLNSIDFIDSSSTPLDYWKRYRGGNYKQVLAEAITHGYQELFLVYPDAYRRDDASLEHFFSTKTKGGKQVISRLARTFKSLCELADFSETQKAQLQVPSTSTPDMNNIANREPVLDQSDVLNIKKIIPHITFNIQVVLPENASTETYNNIFKSIADNLLK